MSRKKRRTKEKKKQHPSLAEIAQAGESRGTRFRYFTWLVIFFALAGLLLRIDVISPWPGADAYTLWWGQRLDARAYLPTFWQSLLPLDELWLLWRRLPSALALVAAALLFYRWGKRLFGKPMVTYGLLALAGSVWLPFFGKLAGADMLALFAHLGWWLSIRFLYKTAETKWIVRTALFGVAACVLAPLSTAILVGLLFAFDYLGGDRQWRPAVAWVAGLTLVAGFLRLVIGGWSPQLAATDYFYGAGPVGGTGSLLLWSIIGLLPAVGFLVGGLRDLVFKLKRREELSLLLAGGLVAGLAAQSLLFSFLLVLVAGKQLQLYFRPNYPWRDWVRSGATLHLVFAFIAAVLFLLGGAIQYQLNGFQAVLGMAAAYWIFSLAAVLGLYGMRRDFAIGGTILAGALTVLFFWGQVYPYLEVDRTWPSELIRGANIPPATTIFVPLDEPATWPAAPHLIRSGSPAVITTDTLNALKPGDFLLRGRPAALDSFSSAAVEENVRKVRGRSVVEWYDFGLEE